MKNTKGQVTTEWVLVGLFLVAIFFIEFTAGQSLFELLISGLKSMGEKQSFANRLP